MNGILGLKLATIEVRDAYLAEKKFNDWSELHPGYAVYDVQVKNHTDNCIALYIFYKEV